MNKEELLKAIEQKRQAIWPSDTHEMAPATVPNKLEQGWLNALKWMENLINSLPAEHTSEDVEEAANIYANKQWLELKPFAIKFFKSGAQWQKEQLMKSAIDGEVTKNFYQKLVVRAELLPNKKHNFCFGDRVKIIVLNKEDNQCSTE